MNASLLHVSIIFEEGAIAILISVFMSMQGVLMRGWIYYF